MKGVTLIGRLPPPSGGIAAHLLDVRALLERRSVRVTVLEPRREARFAAGFLAHAAVDVVHVHHHGHSRRSWWHAAAFAIAPRAVMTIHSGFAPQLIVRSRALVRRASARYRAIVCVSEVIRDAMIAAGVDPERLWVAPAFLADALEERMTPAGVAAVRRRHPLVLAAAVAEPPEYGLPVLLDAFARLRATHPEAALMIAGHGVRRPEHIRAHVYIFGQLARAESLGLLAACDVFVRPSLADGDATSVREALALGRRVVATDAARRPRGVHLCRAGDAADLARALGEAIAAPPPRVPIEQARETLLAIYRRLGVELGEDACAALLAA
jgi:glycosyltransferase involved in cell wall biosynthesis